MMTVRIQIIIAVFIVAFIIVLVSLAKKKALDLKYVLAWMLVAFGVLVLDVFPEVMADISEIIGIFSPVNMVFFVGYLYLGFVVFMLSIALSRQSTRMKKMIQEIALVKHELEETKSNSDTGNNL